MMKVCAGNENAVVGSLRHYLHLKEQPITKNKVKERFQIKKRQLNNLYVMTCTKN